MYYFFNSNAHRKAFIKALKEVENEGYYINQASDDDVVFTTNMSKAVASLSGEKAEKTIDTGKPLDIEEYNPNLDTKRKVPADPKVLSAIDYTMQENEKVRSRLFGDDTTFVDGNNTDEKQFLSGNESFDVNELIKPQDSSIERTIESYEAAEERKRIDEERLRELHEYNERKLKMLEERKRQKEEHDKLLVEVVADKKEEPKTVEEPKPEPVVLAPVEPVAPKAVTPKPVKTIRKRKKVVLKRKKKKYDADIIGGIDY